MCSCLCDRSTSFASRSVATPNSLLLPRPVNLEACRCFPCGKLVSCSTVCRLQKLHGGRIDLALLRTWCINAILTASTSASLLASSHLLCFFCLGALLQGERFFRLLDARGREAGLGPVEAGPRPPPLRVALETELLRVVAQTLSRCGDAGEIDRTRWCSEVTVRCRSSHTFKPRSMWQGALHMVCTSMQRSQRYAETYMDAACPVGLRTVLVYSVV